MKKILLTVFVLLLAGCAGTTKELEIDILVPSGAPALAQVFLQGEPAKLGDNVSYNVSVVDGVAPLQAAFTSNSHDIIFAPINLGAQIHNLGNLNYRLAAVVTFGNIFLATVTDEEFTLESLEDQQVVLFGENQVPDIVARTVLEGLSVDRRYVPTTADAQVELTFDNSRIVMLAEPSLTVAKRAIPGIKTIDLQEAFYERTGHNFAQAGIFISNDLIDNHPEVVRNYLEAVEKSAIRVNTNPNEAARLGVELGFNFPEAVLEAAIPGSNIGFKTAQESKEDIIFLLNRILAINPALLSNRLPDEDFYHVQK